jgi:hypothetical protein
MKKNLSCFKCCFATLLFLLFAGATSWASTVPYTFSNNSAYSDDAIYVAVVGIIDNAHVWIDCKTGTVYPMSTSYNTVTGPVYNGDMGPGGNAKYAACFTQLSNIPDKTISIPKIAGCRILVSFGQQLYLYFYGSTGTPSGYSAPNLQNTSDPNQGIRFEFIELSYTDNGLWSNTTRVDAYQYPMGLEVWGTDGFHKKVGELKAHSEIISGWQSSAPSAFQGCLNSTYGIIQFPTKTSTFSTSYFDSYLSAIWTKYASDVLVFNAGDAGTWKGSVQSGQFVFTRTSDSQTATIANKPSTTEVMEGSGVLASGGTYDKVVQAQFCAAVNRHAIDLTIASGVTQDWSDTSKYYKTSPYNWYAKFWHLTDISYNRLSYAFCYDDVFDQSSTINATYPSKATVTIGVSSGSTDDGQTTTDSCSITGSTGDFSVTVSDDASNPTLTFVPITSGTGSKTCILYYSANASVIFPGYNVTPNTPYQVTAASGSTVYFYYTYSLTSGGENTTLNNKNSFTVGDCSTLKSGNADAVAGETTEAGQDIKVFPNPFTNNLKVTFGTSIYQKVQLIDITGSIIMEKSINKDESSTILDASQVAKGTYYLRLFNGSQTVGKLVVKY